MSWNAQEHFKTNLSKLNYSNNSIIIQAHKEYSFCYNTRLRLTLTRSVHRQTRVSLRESKIFCALEECAHNSKWRIWVPVRETPKLCASNWITRIRYGRQRIWLSLRGTRNACVLGENALVTTRSTRNINVSSWKCINIKKD